MRTNIEIDDELMEEAKEAGPYRTKKQAVEAGLRLLVLRKRWKDLEEIRGPGLFWEGYEKKAEYRPD